MIFQDISLRKIIINNYRLIIWNFQFHCCGVDGPNDWTDQNAAAIPHSCCIEDGGQGTTCSKTQAWQDGCLQKSIDLVKSKSGTLLKIIMAIAGGEVRIPDIPKKFHSSNCLQINTGISMGFFVFWRLSLV